MRAFMKCMSTQYQIQDEFYSLRNLDTILFADDTKSYWHWPCQLKKLRIDVERAGMPHELHIGASTFTAFISSCITVWTASLGVGHGYTKSIGILIM